MVRKPQEKNVQNIKMTTRQDGDAVVISGISGIYPKSNNVKEFSEILYNKINPISTENKRWKSNHPEISQYIGTVPGLNRFDAQFFKVHFRLGNSMDAMSRKIMEQCYQAIYDAGLSPEDLNGKKVAVFIGTCFSETEKASFYVASARTGFGIVGCNKSMFANRISYWLNLKGPSNSIDEACCSSSAALSQAYQAICRGDCEAAIVGSSNLYLHPQSSIHTGRIITNCPDGKTKCFDENADGCAKSEAIQVVFLQKAKNALRIYAEIVSVKNEYLNATGKKSDVGFYREPLIMTDFLKKFYDQTNISPEAVEYVEAMGAAIPEVDKAELETISKVFCNNRQNPLLVGSVMSNIGYTEASSGLCSLIKVLMGYQTGKIPANLHYSNPLKEVPALHDGSIRIVTENEPFRRGYVAINNHSITGCTTHILLNGCYKPKDYSRYKSTIPYLVTISARQESAVQKIFEDLKSRPVDPEEMALLQNIHKTNISGHLGRGFMILDTDAEQKTVSLTEKCEYFDNVRRPLWFVYSGMGSQWPGMGTQLMRIPIFAAAIERCQRALEPKGINLIHILTSTEKTIFDNILHSFVGIAAIQIGLTDVLRELGLVPDKIIGHSVGELGCAYADGCFTAEEMILSAYSRGLVSIQTPFIRGSMAAVGIGYEKIKGLLPPEIEVACHNSAESATISGPSDVMREFVSSLVARGIFAKEVPCSNIAYHSRYIAKAGPKLLEYLSEVIKEPMERSERWVSTSVPRSQWDNPAARTSSAEYHTNNLLNPVLFEEASRLIPANAILVEIAPHGLLQAILKRSLPESCKHIPLTRRGHPDNALMVLESIGKLFMEGYHPKINVLYPKVEFPVSTGTPMLSHLVEWAHNEKWPIPLYVPAYKNTAAAAKYVISLHDPEYNYLRGHVVRGKNVYPFAAALVAVWDTLSMYLNKPKQELSVTFHDVQFFVQPILSDRQLKISVAIQKGEGGFEVMEGNSKVIAGFIKIQLSKKEKIQQINEDMIFNDNDIYQILYERDYSYEDAFRSIHAANQTFTKAQLLWHGNWVTLLDSMLQMNVLRQKNDAVSKPFRIRKICINTKEHRLANIIDLNGKLVLEADVDLLLDKTRCGGISMQGLEFDKLPHPNSEVAVIRTLQFIPHFNPSPGDLKTSIEVCLQIVSENVNKIDLNTVEILTSSEKTASFNSIRENDVYGLKIEYRQLYKEKVSQVHLANVDLVLVQNFALDDNVFSVLRGNTFILSADDKCHNSIRARPSNLHRVVASQNVGEIFLNLIKWSSSSQKSLTTVTVRTQSDLATLSSTRNCLPPNNKLMVLTPYPSIQGTRHLVEKWRKETDRNQIYLVMVTQSKSEEENLIELPHLELAVNILDEGVWGGNYYIHFKDQPSVCPYLSLRCKSIGDLSSLTWVETPEPVASGIAVKVHFAGLNTVDSMRATGLFKVSDEHDVDNISFGMDFSGVTQSGDRVMGLVAAGAVSKQVIATNELLWPVPKHWTLEDAATVPMPYALAFYCLAIKVKMLRKTSILVHGGAGAFGQAVISIALAYGLDVFTTVSDVRKKHFLKKLFPELKEDHIGNSRDSSFRDMVKILTKGVGVTYVINCLKGELKDVSIDCTGPCGITIDLVPIKCDEIYFYKMKNLYLERSYVRVDFSSLFSQKNQMMKLQSLITEGIIQGYVRPLSRITYASNEVPRAFRLLETSQHRGRVLLMLDETLYAQPWITYSQNQTNLVICGDCTLGIQVADRLVKRGAKKLLLHLPNVPANLLYKKQSWETVGVDINIFTLDLNEKKNIETILNESKKMGPIEGIYFITTQYNNKNEQDILNALDVICRKVCPSIKNFAVVSTDKNFGNEICISRAKEQLPATKICLPPIKTFNNQQVNKVKTGPFEDPITLYLACDAFESSLRSKRTITKAHVQKSKRQSLLQVICSIAGKQLTDHIDDNVTLKELGIGLKKVQSIAVLLQEEYNQSLSERTILELSVKQIQELEQFHNGNELKEVKGLGMFFTNFDCDELSSTTEIMLLPTLANHNMTKNDELDITQTYLHIIPGLEGHYERFTGICERIKIQALVLQPGLDTPNESIKQMAARYAQILIKKVSVKNNFYLLGYESGVLVALETAAILEEYGLTGTVYLIGAEADQLKTILKTEIQNTDGELQTAILKHMYKLISNRELTSKHDENLEWKERIELCVRDLLGHVLMSAEYARLNFEMPFNRIKQVLQYKPQLSVLNSKLVLLQPKNLNKEANCAAFQKYTKQALVVHDLSLPLAQALQDLQCPTFINQHLSDDVLESFYKMNFCETYLLSTDTFMTSQDE